MTHWFGSRCKRSNSWFAEASAAPSAKTAPAAKASFLTILHVPPLPARPGPVERLARSPCRRRIAEAPGRAPRSSSARLRQTVSGAVAEAQASHGASFAHDFERAEG